MNGIIQRTIFILLALLYANCEAVDLKQNALSKETKQEPKERVAPEDR